MLRFLSVLLLFFLAYNNLLVECIKNFYVGGIYPSAFYYTDGIAYEMISVFNLAVEMVNNKTDGWWDEETIDVNLIMRLNATHSSQDPTQDQNEYVDEVIQELLIWSDNQLVGLVGGADSGSSLPFADYGNVYILPQISFAATADLLANFAYFSRVVPTDEDNGEAMAKFAGSTLDISDAVVIYEVGSTYSESLRRGFSQAFVAIPNHRVLQDFPFYGVQDDIPNILRGVEATGAPLVVTILSPGYAEDFFKLIPGMVDSEKYLWFIPESVLREDAYIRGACITRLPIPSTTLYDDFIRLWQSVDPQAYYDYDNDRSSISTPYHAEIVDSVFILAMAIQDAIDLGEEVNKSASLFRKQVYTSMVSMNIDMISGPVSFLPNGNFNSSKINILNYNGSSLNVAGSSTKGTYEASETMQFTWPDGVTGYSNPSYSSQYVPYCPPGYNPVLKSSTGDLPLYVCLQCIKGYYKASYGSQACNECPEGAVCEQQGTIVPCVQPGYWRDEPPPGQLGDLATYPIYRCMHEDFCLGGCMLNESCTPKNAQDAPLCGYCTEEYFLEASHCRHCTIRGENSSALFWSFTTITFLFFTGISSWVLWNIISSVKKAHQKLFFERNISVSIKMCVSFAQILSSSLRNVSWSPNQVFTALLSFLNADPTDCVVFLRGALKCAGYMQSYYGAVLFVILFPLSLLTSLAVLSVIMLRIYVPINVDDDKAKIQSERFKRHFYFILSCIGFVCYIPCSAASFSILNCDSLGATGNFLYLDYSVKCSGPEYDALVVLSTIGLLVYSIGIPTMFSYFLYNRDKRDFSRASDLICKGLRPSYKYWEVSDFTRKLLLTSIAQFIAPGRGSQCLFLLFVNLIYLLILTSCRPYINRIDNYSARIFYITECIVFAVALIDSSGLASSDNYDMNALYTVSFVLLSWVIFIVMPFCILNKIPFAKKWFHKTIGPFIPSFLQMAPSKYEFDINENPSAIKNPLSLQDGSISVSDCDDSRVSSSSSSSISSTSTGIPTATGSGIELGRN